MVPMIEEIFIQTAQQRIYHFIQYRKFVCRHIIQLNVYLESVQHVDVIGDTLSQGTQTHTKNAYHVRSLYSIFRL